MSHRSLRRYKKAGRLGVEIDKLPPRVRHRIRSLEADGVRYLRAALRAAVGQPHRVSNKIFLHLFLAVEVCHRLSRDVAYRSSTSTHAFMPAWTCFATTFSCCCRAGLRVAPSLAFGLVPHAAVSHQPDGHLFIRPCHIDCVRPSIPQACPRCSRPLIFLPSRPGTSWLGGFTACCLSLPAPRRPRR